MKKCKYCSEIVQDGAKYCRYCHRRIRGIPFKLIIITLIIAVGVIFGLKYREDITRVSRTVKDVFVELRRTMKALVDAIETHPEKMDAIKRQRLEMEDVQDMLRRMKGDGSGDEDVLLID